MNRSLTKLCRVIALSISGGMSHHVLAFSGHCFSSNGPHQYSFAMNQTVTDVTQVAPGKTLQQSWNENGKYTAWCDNTPGVKSVTYFKAEAGPNMIEAPGNNRFYYIPHTNNILSVQTHMDIVGNGSHRVPFIDLNNHAADDHSNPKATWSSGSSGYITVRVEKEITTARIVIPPTTVVAQLWGSHVPGSYGAAPLVQVVVAGTIVVPQYCTVNAGDVVDIQLGDSWAEDFQTPGEKPNGYTPVTTTIKAHCDNTLATE